MTRSTPLRRALLGLLVVALAAAGCSDGDDSQASTSTTTDPSGDTTDDTTGDEVEPPPVDPTGTGLVCEPVGGVAVPDGVIGVRLTEFEVFLDADTVDAGQVFVQADNAGDIPHEVKIARVDDQDALPLRANGSVDESALGDDLVGEIKLFANGDSCEGTFELDPGTYAVFDNRVSEDGSGVEHVHAADGMLAFFTVE